MRGAAATDPSEEEVSAVRFIVDGCDEESL